METINDIINYSGSVILLLIILLFICSFFMKRFATVSFPIIKFNYRIILGLTTFSILTVFGINASIFSEYDATTQPPYHYNWLNLAHILRFPFDALKANSKHYRPTEIEFTDCDSSKSKINCVLLMDKTTSTYLNSSPAKDSLVKKLRKSITEANGCIKAENLPQHLSAVEEIDNLRDLYCLSFLHSIYASGFADISYQVVFYMGDTQKGQPRYFSMVSDDSDSRPNKNAINYSEAIKIFLKRLEAFKKIENDAMQTNLHSMVDILNQPAFFGNSDERDNYLVWLSDFEEKEQVKPNLARVSLDDISFILLKSTEQAERIRELQRDLPNSLTSSVYETDLLQNQDITGWLRFREKDDEAIYFFHPNRDRYGKYYYQASLNFDKVAEENLYLKFTSHDATTGHSFSLRYNDIECKLNDCIKTTVDGSKLKFYSSKPINFLTNESLYIEIISPKTLKSKRYPVVFLGYIPKAHCIILGTSYLIILFLLLLNSILYLIFYSRYIKVFMNTLEKPEYHAICIMDWVLEGLVGLYILLALIYYGWYFEVDVVYKLILLSLGGIYIFFFTNRSIAEFLKKDKAEFLKEPSSKPKDPPGKQNNILEKGRNSSD